MGDFRLKHHISPISKYDISFAIFPYKSSDFAYSRTLFNGFVFFLSVLFADTSVRAALVQIIPDIFARCMEIGNAELEYFLFDRMLEIVLRFLKNEENMVSIKIKTGK